MDSSFPNQWLDILNRKIPLFKRMPSDLQIQLKKHIRIFIDKKNFIGREGIVISDEIKVVIAAQACLLLLNRETFFFRELKNIEVFPLAFLSGDEHKIIVGESWSRGKVLISWNDTINGARYEDDGNNVVIHEFAHQLDLETGNTDGKPLLEKHENIHSWSTIMAKELKKLKLHSENGLPTLLSEYGATNEAEFFAVASEVFFEQSEQMWERHPELYSQFKHLYQVNPKSWCNVERSSKGNLELHFGTRKMNFNITTLLNKRTVILFADEDNRKVWDNNHQMTLFKEGNDWFVIHNINAVNETLINGEIVESEQKLKQGDILAIGRASKGIIRMPMRVEISSAII